MAQNKTTPQSPQDEDERNDLLATIAASRELGPDMDETLANRYLEERQKADARVRKSQMNQAPATIPQDQQGMNAFGRRAAIMAPLGAVLVAAIIIAAIFTHTWALFGLLWVGLFVFGPAFFGRRRWRQDRWNRRYYRRYGPYGSYGPSGYEDGLPPDAQYPGYPTVGAPPSQGYQQLPQPNQQPTPTTPTAASTPPASPVKPAASAPAPAKPASPATTAASHRPMPPINPAG